jgi:hypothetical protein
MKLVYQESDMKFYNRGNRWRQSQTIGLKVKT